MDTWFADWNNEVEVEIPMPGDQKKPLGVSNGLVELLWQNGEVILHSQTHHKPTNDTAKSKSPDQSTSRAVENSNNSIRDYDETVSWSHCPIDHESFENEFFANFCNPVEANKLSRQFEDVDFFEFSASDDNQFFPSSQQPDFDPISLPPPKFETFDSAQKHQKVDKNSYAKKVATHSESNERETLEQIITSSDSSLWKTRLHCNDTNRRKRKTRDVEESECQSDATQLESSGHKSSLKFRTSRRSRVPEVHNLSERRRRDRINEKMRALQELIPHSNKSGKASVLDEAIQYMKSLQLQLQFMWMRSGMQQYYTSRLGIGIGPPMLSSFQNLMRPSRLPLVDQAITIPNQATIGKNLVSNSVNYQNQTQSPGFREQYANYMCFPSMQNTSQMFSSYFPFNYPHNN